MIFLIASLLIILLHSGRTTLRKAMLSVLQSSVRLFPLQSAASHQQHVPSSEPSCTQHYSGLPATMRLFHSTIYSLTITLFYQNAMEGLIQLTHAAVRPPDMTDFFWRHLEHDITILGQAVGKSEDDVCLLLHLILKNMATKTPASSQLHSSL